MGFQLSKYRPAYALALFGLGLAVSTGLCLNVDVNALRIACSVSVTRITTHAVVEIVYATVLTMFSIQVV